jgi:hypothetical protein
MRLHKNKTELNIACLQQSQDECKSSARRAKETKKESDIKHLSSQHKLELKDRMHNRGSNPRLVGG